MSLCVVTIVTAFAIAVNVAVAVAVAEEVTRDHRRRRVVVQHDATQRVSPRLPAPACYAAEDAYDDRGPRCTSSTISESYIVRVNLTAGPSRPRNGRCTTRALAH